MAKAINHIYLLLNTFSRDTLIDNLVIFNTNDSSFSKITDWKKSETQIYNGKLFYIDDGTRSLCRCNFDGTNKEIITKFIVNNFSIIDGVIFYTAGDKFSSMDSNGSNVKLIFEKYNGASFNILDGKYIFYSVPTSDVVTMMPYSRFAYDTHPYSDLYRMNLDGTENVLVNTL